MLIFTRVKPVMEFTFMAAKKKRLVELLFSTGFSFKTTPSKHTNVD